MSLFGFFQKKKIEKQEEQKKLDLFRKNEIVYEEPKPFEVGKTMILLNFSDGQKLYKTIYGEVSQYVVDGMDGSESVLRRPEEPKVYDVQIFNSAQMARNFLKSIQTHESIYSDDNLATTEVKIGKVISGKIVKTYDHETLFSVAKVVPKQEKK